MPNETPLGWYKWYPRDFSTSIVVRSMSFNARAIYRELLDVQWESGCLPDAKRLLSVLGANAEQWNEFAPYFDELFPNGKNLKLDVMRIEAVSRSEKNRISGSIGGSKKRTPSKRKANAKRTLSETETETETNTDTKVSGGNRKFVAPTLSEVTEYMKTRGFPDPSLDAEGFMAHYEGNGWMTGKNPVKNWMGCVRTFEVTLKKGNRWNTPTKKKELWEDTI